MEVAGLAIGVVSVSSLFASFFDSIERVHQLRGIPGELESAVNSLEFGKISLVFQFLNRDARLPESLRDKISATRRQKKMPPSLNHRFDIAFEVFSAIANIITVGWMHRAARSDNMLPFGQDSSKAFLIGFTINTSYDVLEVVMASRSLK
ncbi:Fc.00g021330.m01.CDS01 [Cosmosporella sp. VM-42]